MTISKHEKYRRYIRALADTTEKRFAEGVNDPSNEEIIRQYYGDLDIPDIGDLLKDEKALRTELEGRGYVIAPTVDNYYTKFDRDPQTDDDIKQCLPIGPGKKVVGMRRITGDPEEDRFWRVWMEVKRNRTQGSYNAHEKEAMKAFGQGLISKEDVEEMLGTNLVPNSKDALIAELLKVIYPSELPLALPPAVKRTVDFDPGLVEND